MLTYPYLFCSPTDNCYSAHYLYILGKGLIATICFYTAIIWMAFASKISIHPTLRQYFV